MGLRYVQLGVRGLLRVFQAQPQHGPHGLLLQLQWHYGPQNSLDWHPVAIEALPLLLEFLVSVEGPVLLGGLEAHK